MFPQMLWKHSWKKKSLQLQPLQHSSFFKVQEFKEKEVQEELACFSFLSEEECIFKFGLKNLNFFYLE